MASNVKKAFEEAGIDVPEVPTSGIAGTETTVPPSAPADATATATTPAPSVPAATDTTPTADKQPVVLSFGRVDREAAAKLREQKKTELEAIPSFVAELVVLLKNPREETILSMTDGTERSLTLEEFEAYIATVVNGTQHRGVRQSFTTAVVEQMLGQFPPSDHLFGVAFTRVSTALTDTDGRGFFFEVEKDWALKNPGNVIWMYRSDGSGKAPFASVAPDSTRLMIATKKWLDEIERAEKSRIKTGTKPFLEAFYQGGETAFFLKKKEIPRRDGGTIIRKAGHFRIHIEDGKNGRIRPVEALESPHHDLFEEMTSRREWVSIGVLAPEIVGADPENRQKMIAAYFRDVENYEQRKRFIRFAHIIIDGYIDALASEKKAAEAPKVAEKPVPAAKTAETKPTGEHRDSAKADYMKLEELKRRGGYISSRSFMLDRKPGVALFSAKTEEKPSRHKNNRGEMVVIPALMVRDSSGKKVAVYHRLGAALEQNEKGEIRMIDCIPSNAKLFAPLKEFITPGEKFANIPEPAAAALRKFYGHEAGDKWKDSLREKRAAQAAQNAAGQPATTPTPPPEAAPSPAADNTINTTAADETAATEANTATGEASPTMEEAREPQPEVGSAEVALTPPVEATEVMSGNDTLSAAPIKLDEGRRRRRDNNRRHQQRGLAA